MTALIRGIPPQHIIDAQDALYGCREAVRCGRGTKRGGLCGQRQARFMPSCRAHATSDETTAADRETVRLEALIAEWGASLTPACHEWPVTENDQAAVAALPVYADDELRTARHVHDLLYRWQQGRCAVCGARERDLVLDHDHDTALARGWLCRSCNTTEARCDTGEFEAYRDRPPAVMLGAVARYESPLFGLVEPEGPRKARYSADQHPAYALMGVLAEARARTAK